MKEFSGFPDRSQYTPIPNLFFSSLLPQIDDIAELKTTLHIFQAIYGKKGYPRFVSYPELLADKNLALSLRSGEQPAGEALNRALEMAVKRRTVIRLTLNREGNPEDIYLINGQTGRQVADKIRNGELVLSGLKGVGLLQAAGDTEPPPDIFTLYEENIGMLTPLIAEELLEAEQLYPEDWIRTAIREAANLNKRSWRYISRILERWSEEGRSDGAHRGDSKTGQDKYSGQKYGHIFQR